MISLIIVALLAAAPPESGKARTPRLPPGGIARLPPGRYMNQAGVEKLVRGRTFYSRSGPPQTYTTDGKHIFSGDYGSTRSVPYFIKDGEICSVLQSGNNCTRVYKTNKSGTILFVYDEKLEGFYIMSLDKVAWTQPGILYR